MEGNLRTCTYTDMEIFYSPGKAACDMGRRAAVVRGARCISPGQAGLQPRTSKRDVIPDVSVGWERMIGW
jgi:hypothetical protein